MECLLEGVFLLTTKARLVTHHLIGNKINHYHLSLYGMIRLIFLRLYLCLSLLLRIVLSILTALITVCVVTLSIRKSQNKYFKCFNYRRHFESMFDTETKNGEITCFHGMRLITTLTVFCFHSFFVKLGNIEPKSQNYEKLGPKKILMTMALGAIVVDTFLIISAILVTLTVLKYLRRQVVTFNITCVFSF